MGRWIYVNALVLVISVGFMYLHFAQHYQPQLHVYILGSLFWLIVYALGHYIFIYKMKAERVMQGKTSESTMPVHPEIQSKRPKPVLKKERPKVDLKKKNNSNHDK